MDKDHDRQVAQAQWDLFLSELAACLKKKKKRAITENFLEELNFLLGFKFQEVNKIECAFENL